MATPAPHIHTIPNTYDASREPTAVQDKLRELYPALTRYSTPQINAARQAEGYPPYPDPVFRPESAIGGDTESDPLIKLISETLRLHRTLVVPVHKSDDPNTPVHATCQCGWSSKQTPTRAKSYDRARAHQAHELAKAIKESQSCQATREHGNDTLSCEVLTLAGHDWHSAVLPDGAELSWKD